MENTLKMKVELEELEEGVAIDVEMKGKCTAPIAEKVIISILDAFHNEAPISTLIDLLISIWGWNNEDTRYSKNLSLYKV